MIIKRILQFLEINKISKRQFYRETELSNGFLDKVKDIGTSKAKKILETYPELNMKWLILGEGEMFKKEDIIYETKHTENVTLLKGHKKGHKKGLKRNIQKMSPFNETEDNVLASSLLEKVLERMYEKLKNLETVDHEERIDKLEDVVGKLVLLSDDFSIDHTTTEQEKKRRLKPSENKEIQDIYKKLENLEYFMNAVSLKIELEDKIEEIEEEKAEESNSKKMNQLK